MDDTSDEMNQWARDAVRGVVKRCLMTLIADLERQRDALRKQAAKLDRQAKL